MKILSTFDIRKKMGIELKMMMLIRFNTKRYYEINCLIIQRVNLISGESEKLKKEEYFRQIHCFVLLLLINKISHIVWRLPLWTSGTEVISSLKTKRPNWNMCEISWIGACFLNNIFLFLYFEQSYDQHVTHLLRMQNSRKILVDNSTPYVMKKRTLSLSKPVKGNNTNTFVKLMMTKCIL